MDRIARVMAGVHHGGPRLALLLAAVLATSSCAGGATSGPTASTAGTSPVTGPTAPAPSPSASASVEPGGWLLAARKVETETEVETPYGFDSVRHEWSGYVVIDAAGTVLSLPERAGRLFDLHWSPDGTRFAGSMETDPGHEGGDRVVRPVVVPVDPSAPITLLTREPIDAAIDGWSPDGRSTLLITGDAFAGSAALLLAPADGSGERRLAEDVWWGAWSPDGRAIAAMGLTGLVLVDPVDGRQTALAHEANRPLGWTPDSAAVVYEAPGDPCSLCIVSPGGAGPRPLLADGDLERSLIDRSLVALGWRDARTMLVAYDPTGPADPNPTLAVELSEIDLDAGTLTPIVVVERAIPMDMALSPDGSTVAFAHFDDVDSWSTSIWTLRLDGGSAAALAVAPPGGSDSTPSWQPTPAPIDWPAFVAPTPEPPPSRADGTGRLVVDGAHRLDVELTGQCYELGEEVRIDLADAAGTSIQFGLSPDGTTSGLVINLDGFMAFPGKGYEPVEPWLVVEPGSTPGRGSVTFADLPNAYDDGSGETLSGTLDWECPGFG